MTGTEEEAEPKPAPADDDSEAKPEPADEGSKASAPAKSEKPKETPDPGRAGFYKPRPGHRILEKMAVEGDDWRKLQKELDKQGVDIRRWLNEDGMTLLHLFVCQNRYHSVRLLLERGIDPNGLGINETGSQPALCAAATSPHYNLVSVLLAYNADPLLKPVKGKECAQIQARRNCPEFGDVAPVHFPTVQLEVDHPGSFNARWGVVYLLEEARFGFFPERPPTLLEEFGEAPVIENSQASHLVRRTGPDPNDKTRKACSNCNLLGATLQCTGCRGAVYCDRTCQKRHWKQCHQWECGDTFRKPSLPQRAGNFAWKWGYGHAALWLGVALSYTGYTMLRPYWS
eukprot:gnl/TRDRNA2_/TRDRNA2_62899_c0_seq1.p1 gnl/TRDRNA2_/TRDRNA2_62899_c0~~gnl/TRDRNA2_/TRDRNA2_62899_c0_seq1.p1  ORF type:complete len:362 (-),score=59.17 gnl/TRDRNA2_/TRDRNA2_62899_c0_seq1:337-1365(-)